MRWTWKQAAGELWRGDKLIAQGYSGAPGHVNKTESEALKNKGPLPRGLWRMATVFPKHPRLGPVAISLVPVKVEMFGRSDFMIHADNRRMNQTASQGCIILDLATRTAMSACVGRPGGGDLLEVI